MYKKMSEHLTAVNREISRCNLALQNCPKGKLICTKNGPYTKWYVNNGNKYKYIPKKNREYALQLAEKKLLQYKLKYWKKEKKACELYMKYHAVPDEEATRELVDELIFADLLAKPFNFNNPDFESWINEEYNTNPRYPENLIHKSAAGHMRRSKSEALIDTLLCNHNIPFRYECELNINDSILYPDFTILHPISGEIIYWEHFGKIDDPTYLRNCLSKLSLYASVGIYPNINLIITCETGNHPLNYEEVEWTIQRYLL